MTSELSPIEKLRGELRIMGMGPRDYSLYYTQFDGKIKEVELRYNKTQDHLPSQIFKIQGLNILRVSNIKSLPNEIEKLKDLRLLEVVKHKNRKLNDNLCKLENLELLIIRRTNIEKLPAQLEQMGNLRDLDLINNKIPVVPEALSKLPNLRYLSLSGFYDTPKELAGKLSKMNKLTKLFIGKFKDPIFPDIWEGISELTELTNLTISGYSNTDEEITFVSPLINNLQKLESLWVDGSVMCFPDIPDLTNLEELYLTFTPINESAKQILKSRQGVCINPDCVLHPAKGESIN